MQVRVQLRREGGAFRPPYGQGHTGTGDLHLTHRTADGRRIPLLQLLGSDRQWPSLYDPKLVSLGSRQLAFVGFERNGQAWVLQQWDCEVLYARRAMPAGAYRRVIPIGPVAVKLPRLRQFARGMRCNRWEREIWNEWRPLFHGWTEVLCPVLCGDRWGLILVMPRAKQPVSFQQVVAAMGAEDRYPEVDIEYKPENYGRYRGRVVALDYGIDDEADLLHRREYLRSKAPVR